MAKKVTGPIFHRLFENVFVCLRCKRKQRADPLAIRDKRVHCRKCGMSAFRPKSKQGKR